MSKLKRHQYTSHYEGAEYESDIGVLQFFTQNLNLGKLVPKLNSCWTYF